MNEEWYLKKKITLEPGGIGLRLHTEHDVGEPWRVAQKHFEYFKNPENGFSDGNVNHAAIISSVKDNYIYYSANR